MALVQKGTLKVFSAANGQLITSTLVYADSATQDSGQTIFPLGSTGLYGVEVTKDAAGKKVRLEPLSINTFSRFEEV